MNTFTIFPTKHRLDELLENNIRKKRLPSNLYLSGDDTFDELIRKVKAKSLGELLNNITEEKESKRKENNFDEGSFKGDALDSDLTFTLSSPNSELPTPKFPSYNDSPNKLKPIALFRKYSENIHFNIKDSPQEIDEKPRKSRSRVYLRKVKEIEATVIKIADKFDESSYHTPKKQSRARNILPSTA